MYAREVTEASKSALLELGLALKRYHDNIVLAGGWAPYFITEGFFPHCGSIDSDLVLETRIMPKYETIRKSIIGLGYVAENPFRFSRIVKSPMDGKEYEIHLDFLCDREDGSKYLNLKRVQDDLQAFMFAGLNVAFDFNFEQGIETTLPNNGAAKTTFKVVDLVGSLALKGQALDGRSKPKDAYDIFALTHYGGGPTQAAGYFNGSVLGKAPSPQTEKLLEHSISIIREKFRDAGQMGPFQVETFTENKFKRNIVAGQVTHFLENLKFGGKDAG